MSARSLPAVLFYCLALLPAGAFAQAPGAPPAPVVIADVIEREIVPSQSFVGMVQAPRRSIIGSAVDGRIEEMLVEEGDWVQFNSKQEPPVVTKIRTKTIEIEIAAAEAALDLRKHELTEMQSSRPEEVAASEAKMRAAEALMKFATDKLARDKKLFEQGRAVSQEEFERSQSGAEAALKTFEAVRNEAAMMKLGPRLEKRAQGEAMVRMAQEEVNRLNDRLEKYFVKAPFNGYVVGKHTEVGAWIRSGEPVVEVIEVDPIEVVIHVPQQQANYIRPGMSVQVSTDAIPTTLKPGSALVGQVAAIVPDADSRTRTFPIKIRLRNPLRAADASVGANGPADASVLKPSDHPDHLLKPGMICRANLRVGSMARAILVPKDAVVVNGAVRQIAIFHPDPAAAANGPKTGKISLVPVETGASEGSAIEILGGVLKPGQWVVSQGNERVRPDQQVGAIRTLSTASLLKDGK